jgi:hypothetical protein
MSIKYMCDKCEEKEGTHQIESGEWLCVGCYSSRLDHIYEEQKDRACYADAFPNK